METIAEISGYYARGGELNGLDVGRSRLEFCGSGMPCGE